MKACYFYYFCFSCIETQPLLPMENSQAEMGNSIIMIEGDKLKIMLPVKWLYLKKMMQCSYAPKTNAEKSLK